jgi:class 3 adenylate cyclase
VIPKTHYAKDNGLHLAYQVWGDGPIDIVLVWGTLSHCELFWEDPPMARFLEALGRFARVIQFDKRGTGLSDAVAQIPTLEERMDDVRIVMDAAGSERAVLFGESEGAPMSCLFAATFPERVSQLVLYGALLSLVNRGEFQEGWSLEEVDAFLDAMERGWGTGQAFAIAAPSRFPVSEELQDVFGRFERQALTPGAFHSLMTANARIDIQPVLPSITVPTLVLHRSGDRMVPVGHGRFMAEHIPGARYVELDGIDHYVAAGDIDAILRAIREFLTGVDADASADVDRVLATVLFTDIVKSTETAVALGDRKWTDLLDSHDRLVRQAVERGRGRLVKTTGDGALATFDGPARAVRAAETIVKGVRPLGIDVRAGVHTGEVELRGTDVGGVGVHIGARVQALAAAGQVMVSRTVVDLVAGSGLEFADAGVHALKGVPGEWQLFALAT